MCFSNTDPFISLFIVSHSPSFVLLFSVTQTQKSSSSFPIPLLLTSQGDPRTKRKTSYRRPHTHTHTWAFRCSDSSPSRSQAKISLCVVLSLITALCNNIHKHTGTPKVFLKLAFLLRFFFPPIPSFLRLKFDFRNFRDETSNHKEENKNRFRTDVSAAALHLLSW